jgi:hypothetical protein
VASIHQINLSYDGLEDRALLRLSTTARAEFRFWLTRRFVRALWPALVGALRPESESATATTAEARDLVLSFQHEAALGEGDFATPYHRDAVEFPLGEAPLLLGRASIRRTADGRPMLKLLPADGRGIEVALGPVLLHSLCELVRDVAQKAGWGLELEIARPATAPSGQQH